MSDLTNNSRPDPWKEIRRLTAARIARGHVGVSVTSREMLDFRMDHAHARDAIYSIADVDRITASLEAMALPAVSVKSQATTRQAYIQRPDLGRRLSAESQDMLRKMTGQYTLSIIAADGLSAIAMNRHLLPILKILIPNLQAAGITLAPITLVEQGRVAISDDIGSALGASMALIFIGERPGLSSPDSLGAYLTYAPATGTTDESRNCVSNIRPEGLGYLEAADKIFYLITESRRRKLSGVMLKDHTGRVLPEI